MWGNGRFTSWMCSREIHRNCVMLEWQYGPKSLRNVSNTLLNLSQRIKAVLKAKWGPTHLYIYIYIHVHTHNILYIQWPQKTLKQHLEMYECHGIWLHSHPPLPFLLANFEIFLFFGEGGIFQPQRYFSTTGVLYITRKYDLLIFENHKLSKYFFEKYIYYFINQTKH